MGVAVEGLGFGVAINEVREDIPRLAQGEVICQPIPDILGGTTRTNKEYRYKVTVPTGAKWDYKALDDGTVFVERGENFVPARRSAREFLSAVIIWTHG